MRALHKIFFIQVLAVAWSAAPVRTESSILHDLLQCYNVKSGPTPASFDSFLQQQPPSLEIYKAWQSAAPAKLQLTIITAATLSRLDALEAQCSSWAGPLTAAVYVVLQQEAGSSHGTGIGGARRKLQGTFLQHHSQLLENAAAQMQGLFERSELQASSGGCQLRALLLYELTLDPTISSLLPINALRNAALVAADTSLVALVDVDLLVSRSLAEELQDPTKMRMLDSLEGVRWCSLDGTLGCREALLGRLGFQQLKEGCSHKQAWILPAFETSKLVGLEDGKALVEKAIQGSKAELAPLISEGKLQPFASVFYPRGHSCTNFNHWYNADVAYPIEFTINCEPWFIIDRLSCPPYDARFRGYGWNKVQQVALVNASAFKFMVHPSAFIVHRPHPRSEAQGLYTSAATSQGNSTAAVQTGGSQLEGGTQRQKAAGGGASLSKLFHRKVAAMRHVALRDMRRGTYVAVEDGGSTACKAQLAWWRHPSR